MRFSAVLTLPPQHLPAVGEAMRQLVEPTRAHPQVAPVSPQCELPQDLDQRVREIGEW